jgi:transcriptional regulator with XRE-family HTH domain
VGLPEDVGRRIAEVRMANGWTQEECAVRLQMTVRRLRRFEAGANVTLQTLERIAAALGVTPRALLEAPRPYAQPRRGRPPKFGPATAVPTAPTYVRARAALSPATLHETTEAREPREPREPHESRAPREAREPRERRAGREGPREREGRQTSRRRRT